MPAAWPGDTVAPRASAGGADPEGTAFAAALGLAPILPLAPVHLRAVRDADGDVALAWVRRSRADTDSWSTADAPQDNVPEGYRVTIFDGADPVRIIEAAAPAATTRRPSRRRISAACRPVRLRRQPDEPVYGPGHAASGAFHA